MAGAGAFMGWHTVCGILTFGFLKVLVLECARAALPRPVTVQAIRQFRVDPAHEIRGLDVVKHSEPAYPIGERRQPGLQYQPCALSRCLHRGRPQEASRGDHTAAGAEAAAGHEDAASSGVLTIPVQVAEDVRLTALSTFTLPRTAVPQANIVYPSLTD